MLSSNSRARAGTRLDAVAGVVAGADASLQAQEIDRVARPAPRLAQRLDITCTYAKFMRHGHIYLHPLRCGGKPAAAAAPTTHALVNVESFCRTSWNKHAFLYLILLGTAVTIRSDTTTPALIIVRHEWGAQRQAARPCMCVCMCVHACMCARLRTERLCCADGRCTCGARATPPAPP